jgi:uncharacterized membrane protein YeaQ/YmgE (transglycosylase-associated protein family)
MPTLIACILIGAAVGFAARFLYPGAKKPSGFILTTVIGIIGAALATLLAHTLGFVEGNQLADPISMVVGAIIVLIIWNVLVAYGFVREPGAPN